MSQKTRVILIVFLLYCLAGYAQPEKKQYLPYSDRALFQMHVDSIKFYLYRDAQKVDALMEKCEAIKERSQELTDSDYFSFAIQKIYALQNKGDYLGCYQIIENYEHLLLDESVPEKDKNTFSYIASFTYMTLGDINTAQEGFYQLVEKGRILKDTSLIINGLYSLGQIYSDEKDYESAIKTFLKLNTLKQNHEINLTTSSLIDYELSEAYMESGKIEKAENVIKNAIKFLDEHKMERLKSDFLIFQGQIALKNNQVSKAEEIYREINELAQKSKDYYTLLYSQSFHAELLTRQRKYTKAISIYADQLEQVDTTALSLIHSIYGNVHETFLKMGDSKSAYKYLLKQQEVGDKIRRQEKERQTAYLKVKFESEQKELENQQLALEVIQDQSRIRYLYLMIGLFILGLLFLFGAFYQKRKFSQTLQKEVKNRTKELEKSNYELEKFVYMASHDLKQPLTTINSFSKLLNDEVALPKIKTYSKYIEDSGNRMMDLIENVLEYSELSQYGKDLEVIDLNELIDEVEKILPKELFNKNGAIKLANPLPVIKYDRKRILVVFKNLIENGLHYNTSQSPTVTISSQIEKEYVKIFIQDNGIGLEQKYHDKIFQMFSRLQNHKDYNGSGLGLSICKKVVNNMGGEIGVEVTSDKQGSLFYFTIPLSLIAVLEKQDIYVLD